MGLNTNSIISNIPYPNIFTKNIKLFNQTPPKIHLSLNNQEAKNVVNNNSLNLVNNLNNNVNEPKNKINTNSNISTNKNLFRTTKIDNINNKNNINNNRQLNYSFNSPIFPSFLSFINEEKTENNNINSNIMNNNINENLARIKNYPINGDNIFINPITNNINKIDSFIKYKEPLIVKNPNNNFINRSNSTISKLLFPGISQLSLISSANNNFLSYPINPLNNKIKPPSINIPKISNINRANDNASMYMNEKRK